MYVIVGFKVQSERNVYYAKAKNQDELAQKVVYAFTRREANFVSIRYIKEVVFSSPAVSFRKNNPLDM